MKNKYILLLSIMMIVFCSENSDAYSTNVHRRITENVISLNADSFNIYLGNIGITKGIIQYVNNKLVREWIEDGSYDEDYNFDWWRFYDPLFSHFYNPLTNSSGVGNLSPSAYDWANDSNNTWSWQKARDNFYNGLTLTTTIDREKALSDAFGAIGHVMHLVEDMAVPAHTRADLHASLFPVSLIVGKDNYETYTDKNISTLNYASISFPYWSDSSTSGAPRQLWDLDVYDGSSVSGSDRVGLAEYSNANFFSNSTIFNSLPFPAWTSVVEFDDTDAITGDVTTYLRKQQDGEVIDHLAAERWYYKSLPSNLKHLGLKLDSKVCADYADKLIPHAVGYSAGLLDYFFRGTIDISLPSNGIYSMVNTAQPGFNPATATFTNINLLAKNSSSTGEQMTNGNIKLVVKYRLAQGDPFHSVPVSVGNEIYYIVVQEANNVTSIPSNTTVLLTFNLSPALPLYATDVYLQVVFKGTLGHEDNAIAVGFKDISEPRPCQVFS